MQFLFSLKLHIIYWGKFMKETINYYYNVYPDSLIEIENGVYFYLNGCTNKQSATEINEYIIENCQFKYEIMGNKVYYKE